MPVPAVPSICRRSSQRTAGRVIPEPNGCGTGRRGGRWRRRLAVARCIPGVHEASVLLNAIFNHVRRRELKRSAAASHRAALQESQGAEYRTGNGNSSPRAMSSYQTFEESIPYDGSALASLARRVHTKHPPSDRPLALAASIASAP